MKNYRIITIITMIMISLPLIAQAHVQYLEPECLVKKNQEVNTAAPWPSVEFGGFDYSFEYPLIFPDDDLITDRNTHAYLAAGDVDVHKITISEGVTGTLRAYTLTAACQQYYHFYPVVSVFGPGLPPLDEDLPFEIPEELDALGHMRTYPVESPVGERPVYRMTDRVSGLWIWSWFLDRATQEIRIQDPEPGTYYIVVWDPDGKAGDYTFATGFENLHTPEEERQRDIVVPLITGMKTTVCDCIEAEGPSPFPF